MKLLAMIAITTMLGTSAIHADPIELADYAALQRPAPTTELRYGSAAAQAIDVFLPAGHGPHPVAILVHGGCWMDLPGAGREQLRGLGADLAQHGIAVWSIGYRRANEAGGGYPGTYRDVATAIDRLQVEAEHYDLDLARTVLVGHSAGGHLALWAATRHSIRVASPLHVSNPLLPGAVISLAGVGDLKAFSRFVPLHCAPGILERLLPANTQAPYAEISPAEIAPPQMKVTMISGILDRLIPPYLAHDYARVMRDKHGKQIELVDIPGAGHFDVVTPGTVAWRIVRAQIARDLRARSPDA